MDQRRKHIDQDAERQLRATFYEDIKAGRLSIAEAVARMRRISRLTQPEFAKHRGISVGTLKQIESGTGNPKVETLNQVAAIFGLEVGFIAKRKAP
jgi:DNA-binding XRE family transcriptional regulator